MFLYRPLAAVACPSIRCSLIESRFANGLHLNGTRAPMCVLKTL